MKNLPPYQKKHNHVAQYKPIKIEAIVLIYYTNKRKEMFSDLTIFIYETFPRQGSIAFFPSNRLFNSPTMAAFQRECCKDAGILLNLSGSLFCKCDSMHSIGINLLVGCCTVRPVLGQSDNLIHDFEQLHSIRRANQSHRKRFELKTTSRQMVSF